MGSKLSCMSKAKLPKNHSNGNSPNRAVKQQPDSDTEYVSSAKANPCSSTPPVANGQPKKSPAKSSDPMIPLPAAPSSYQVPVPVVPLEKLPKQAAPEASQLTVTQECPTVYKNQPADLDARKVARSGPRPSTWKDLSWNLLGIRDLKTQEQKVRAIFTWLCSLDPERIPFPDQAEKDKEVKKPPPLDSIERVANALVTGRSTYFQVFQTLCNAVGIECHVVRGIAKGVAYDVGQRLTADDPNGPLIDPKTQKLQPQLAHLEHAWNAAKVDSRWRLFDPAWAARRLAVGLPEEQHQPSNGSGENPISQASQAVLTQYQTDMFYFMTDPSRLIYSHLPADPSWQLLAKPSSLKKFQDCVLLKPSFFRYGLGLYSHSEGLVPVKNELTIKFLLPEAEPDKLLFTYNLTLEGLGQIYQGKNLSTYGIHTISLREKMVTFMFRFPKRGVYKLVIYARKQEETLFADVCEYKIQAEFETLLQKSSSSGQAGGTSTTEEVKVLPFPPCNQSSYGPTSKAALYGLQTLPMNLDPILAAQTGFVEVRFCQSNAEQILPKLAARLKSVQLKEEDLNDCILHRQTEASKATTGFSSMWSSAQGACIPMNVVTAYLPEIGEYALEIFAKPSDSDEEASYHLVWQFLITAHQCWSMSKETQQRLAMIEMGPREPIWSDLELRTLSHQDPLIRISTVARTGADLKKRGRSERQLISEFAATHNSSMSGVVSAADSMASQVTVIDKSEQSDRADVASPTMTNSRTLSPLEEAQMDIRPRDCDLHVVIEIKNKKSVMLLAQMVDISSPGEEQDVTNYVFREPEDDEDRIHREELSGGLSDSSLAAVGRHPNPPWERVTYLVRVPKGGHFYKLFFYACPREMDPEEQIPLVYTYLIEAPARITSSEIPYIGSLGGPFPEKALNTHQVSLRI